MEEFKPITTQQEFDSMVGERLKRAEEKYSQKYADYDDLKKKTTEYEKQIAEFTKQLEEANKKVSGHDKEVADLNAKIKGYETNSVKMRIAHETGIPYELAGRLSGEDEASIRKDAENLSKIIGRSGAVAPLGSTEPVNVDPKKAALKALLDQVKNK